MAALGAEQVAIDAEEVVGGQQGNAAPHCRLIWTCAMSCFVLRHFTDLVGEGVKTDKGFKDVYLNKVARDLSEFTGQEVTGSQVYNHLRKWHARWVKICRLKEISGSLWDEELNMITLAPEHYAGHVKVTICDLKFCMTAYLINYCHTKGCLYLIFKTIPRTLSS